MRNLQILPHSFRIRHSLLLNQSLIYFFYILIFCKTLLFSKQNFIDLWGFSDGIIQLNFKQGFKENMEEEYEGGYEGINGFWPEVNRDSQQSDFYWNSDQNQSGNQNKLADLYKAKQRFREFIEELGQFKKTAIRQDVLKYCETQKKKQKSIDVHYKPETILKKIEVRIDKMIKTKRIKRNWGEEDIKILLWIISKYCDWKGYNNIEKQLQKQDWKFIATLIPGVNSEICMFKWLSLKKITLSHNSWSEYESNLLSLIVKDRNDKGFKHNSEIHDWKQISQELYKLNLNQDKVYRNAKQCREHWTCYLSPQLKKGPWQLYEDVRLLKFIQSNNGLKKWSEISKFFEGRTQNALKNRYTLIVEKQRKLSKNKHKSQLEIVSDYLEKCYIQQYTSQKQEDHLIYDQEELKKEEVSCEIPYHQKQQKLLKRDSPTFNNHVQLNTNKTISAIHFSLAQAQVKIQQNFEQIFEDRDSSLNANNYLSIDRYPESLSGDSNNGNISAQTRSITPIKVEVFKFKDFEKLGMENFLKKIQPGVMDAAGTFKKVDRLTVNDDWNPTIIKM